MMIKKIKTAEKQMLMLLLEAIDIISMPQC
jgi:hypothetical protein